MEEFIAVHHIELALFEIKINSMFVFLFLTMDTLFLYSNPKGDQWLHTIFPASKYLGLLALFLFVYLFLISFIGRIQ